MKYVLGLDQGGSKTRAIIGDSGGHILGFGTGPGASYSSQKGDQAMAGIRDAARQAFTASGLSPEKIDIMFAGMSGMDWPDEEDLLRGAINAELNIARIHVVNDCLIAMRGGTAKSYGAVLCAGSGMNCAARTPEGKEYVYGFYVQDADQGGGALGNVAIQAVLDAEAGLVPPTDLSSRLLAHFGCATVDELLRIKVTSGLDKMASYTLPVLLENAAQEGIPAAVDIFVRYGRRWAQYVIAVLRRLRLLDTPLDVVLSGGIFKCRNRTLIDTITTCLAAEAAFARVVEAVFEPIVGAYLLGIEQLGFPASGLEETLIAQAVTYPLLRLSGSGQDGSNHSINMEEKL